MLNVNVGKSVVQNIDVALFSLPVVISCALGTGFNVMENSDKRILKTVGWLGTRCCILMTLTVGLPLVVWSIAKLFFAQMLNTVTLHKFSCLKAWTLYTNIQLNFVIAGLSVLPCLLLINTLRTVKLLVTKGFAALPQMINEMDEALEQVPTVQALFRELSHLGHVQQQNLPAGAVGNNPLQNSVVQQAIQQIAANPVLVQQLLQQVPVTNLPLPPGGMQVPLQQAPFVSQNWH